MDVVEVERYDPYNKSWCAISPALKYVSNFAAASCSGKLYLVGSCAVKYNALTLQCYNPVQGESCHTLLPHPTGVSLGEGLRGTPGRRPLDCQAVPVGCEQGVVMAVAQEPQERGCSSTNLSHRCLTQPRAELCWSRISEALGWGFACLSQKLTPRDNATSPSWISPIPQHCHKPRPYPPLFFMQDPGLGWALWVPVCPAGLPAWSASSLSHCP